MRRIACPLLCLLFLVACDDDQTRTASCPEEIEEFIIDNYSEDAKQLLFKQIISDTQHPDRYKPEFNQERLDTILKSIQSVYNLNTPERDSVFEIHNIHVFPWYHLSLIALKVNPEAEEIKNLVTGISPTGNSNLDLIIKKYNFSVDKPDSYPQSPWIYITATQSYNLLPIINDLRQVPSIIIAEQSGALSFGYENDIHYEKMNDKIILDFELGDCWTFGCISNRHWIFEVDNNCQAIFKESYSY